MMRERLITQSEKERARVESERERENAHSQIHRSKELETNRQGEHLTIVTSWWHCV